MIEWLIPFRTFLTVLGWGTIYLAILSGHWRSSFGTAGHIAIVVALGLLAAICFYTRSWVSEVVKENT